MSDETGEPGWLLESLVMTVPGARSALLLSADGLALADYGLGKDAADQMAPLAASLCSLTRQVGRLFGGGDIIRQLAAELSGAIFMVSSAGYGSVIAVLAERETDAGVLGYEMSQLVKSVAPFLASRPRAQGMVTRQAAEPAELPSRLPPAVPPAGPS
jgi:predicted regulator of Ras-like GTPase activity (Roadblock/LC7/MglB family)